MKKKIDLVDKAKKYAYKLHDGKFRKDGKTPYIFHPAEVVNKLKKDFGIKDPDVLAIAWLHDVVEEGGDLDDIHKVFGGKIADGVNMLTKWKHYGKEVDYALYLLKMKMIANDDHKLIKYCDCMVNLDDLNNIPDLTDDEKEKYIVRKKLMLEKIVPDIFKYLDKIKK